MRRAVLLALLLVAGTLADAADGRFRPVDVYVDSGTTPLAAYQVEVTASEGVELVGVEGGEPPAFATPPYYDPAALKGHRIVLAAFHVGDDVPFGRHRVATLHVHEPVAGSGRYDAKLVVAAGPDGEPIPARVTVVPSEGDAR